MGLLNSTILDVVIGLAFVYLLLALICTTINEWLAGLFGIRAKTLAVAIKQMLDQQPGSGDPTRSFLQQFYSHPLITGMMTPGSKPGASLPSYLPSRTFATTVVDITTSNKPGAITFADLDAGIKALPNGDVKAALLALIQNANNDLDLAKKNIEQWFDDTMDRASGWYKRRTQVVTILIAILLTGMTNADTVRITHILWKSPTLRATLVEKAKGRTESPQSGAEYKDKNNPLKPSAKPTKDELDKLQMVLGWSDEKVSDLSQWPERIIGWILTIVALSLGAPFWFDLLNKLMNIRNAGKKPQKSDAQPAKQDDTKTQAA
jgi:hypothetical protein